MIAVTPFAAGLWAVALMWPSVSINRGHTLPELERFRSEDECIHALPRYEVINQVRYGGRGSPQCVPAPEAEK